MNSYQSGKIAEFVARIFLSLKGYRFVAHNVVCGRGTTAGEIDLIMCKRKTLVFLEVKKRKNIETAAYAISLQQQKRIRRAAQWFLAHHFAYNDFDCRFDAVLVSLPFKIQHIENAW